LSSATPWGSYVGQRFALDHPERTLGLIGSFTTVRGNPAVVDLWASAVSKLLDPIDPDFVAEFQRSTLARPVPQTFLDMVVEESLKVPARVWRAALQGLFMADHSGELQKIRAPTLIVWGHRDEFFSPMIRTRLRRRSRARSSWSTRVPDTRPIGKNPNASRPVLRPLPNASPNDVTPASSRRVDAGHRAHCLCAGCRRYGYG
jgi:pimeloyl-ACP methyl ester carboxylesterase